VQGGVVARIRLDFTATDILVVERHGKSVDEISKLFAQ
jgi:hypothetical protein